MKHLAELTRQKRSDLAGSRESWPGYRSKSTPRAKLESIVIGFTQDDNAPSKPAPSISGWHGPLTTNSRAPRAHANAEVNENSEHPSPN